VWRELDATRVGPRVSPLAHSTHPALCYGDFHSLCCSEPCVSHEYLSFDLSCYSRSALARPCARRGGSEARERDRRCVLPAFSAHAPFLTSVRQDTRTPLHWAASVGALDVARFLLDHGANADLADGAGWTPLHIAGELRIFPIRMKVRAECASQRGPGGRRARARRRRCGREACERQGLDAAVSACVCMPCNA
jgi:hypothetical protein